jgi:hypothetical protein
VTIKFPAKESLRFDQVVDRWKCEEDDLINLVVNAELKPSIKAFHDWKIVQWVYHGDAAVMLPSENAYDGQTGDEIPTRPSGWYYLQLPHQTGLLKASFELVTEERNPEIPMLEGIGEVTWFRIAKAMSMQDVKKEAVFLIEEIVNFEAKFKEPPVGQATESGLSTRERNNLLCLVGGLLGLLLGKSPSGNKNSVYKDQVAIIGALNAHYPSVQGFGESTLEEKFALANKRIAQFSSNPR